MLFAKCCRLRIPASGATPNASATLEMLRKSPTVAKGARMGHPTSRATSKCAAMVADWRRSVKRWGRAPEPDGVASREKSLDIFLYGHVMLGHGKGGHYIRCV